jgi:hypothetical protein
VAARFGAMKKIYIVDGDLVATEITVVFGTNLEGSCQ